MVGCVTEVVGVGPQSRGTHDLLGGVGCKIKILMGAGVVDGSSNEKCLSGVNKESLLKQLRRGWVKASIVCRCHEEIMKVSPSLPP